MKKISFIVLTSIMFFNDIKTGSGENNHLDDLFEDIKAGKVENCEEILEAGLPTLQKKLLSDFKKCGDAWFPTSCVQAVSQLHSTLLAHLQSIFQYCELKNKKNKLSNCQQKFLEKQITLKNKLEASEKSKTFIQKFFDKIEFIKFSKVNKKELEECIKENKEKL